jgi:acetyltransferase-like isoleucine patch superfamily enzyme
MSDSTPKTPARFADPLDLAPRFITKLYSLWISATFPFASCGKGVSIQYPCLMNKRMAHKIKLGNSVAIRKDAWLNILPEAASGLNIIIDDGCLVGARSVISAKNSIHLEKDVIIATSVLIMDHNHTYEDINRSIKDQGPTPGGPIRIEQGCWIGHGAAIVCNEGGLVIGRNSVIAANALVTRSFPPYSVIVGNPARLARQFDPVKGIWLGGRSTTVETAR